MNYQVILPKSAQKELDRLPWKIAERILDALEGLKTQPRPPGCKKLHGENAWRLRVGDYRVGDYRVGDYRVIYEIHDKVLQVLVVTVGHRREVYR
jgi:mRNA interferase RelE/StbE